MVVYVTVADYVMEDRRAGLVVVQYQAALE
jgi:hypothetical protein